MDDLLRRIRQWLSPDDLQIGRFCLLSVVQSKVVAMCFVRLLGHLTVFTRSTMTLTQFALAFAFTFH